jgi:hypothetical protein
MLLHIPDTLISCMYSTKKATAHPYCDAPDEITEGQWHFCTTFAQSRGDLLAPDDTSDHSVLTVDWDGPDDPENPRK